jgi:hypothetical protein
MVVVGPAVVHDVEFSLKPREDPAAHRRNGLPNIASEYFLGAASSIAVSLALPNVARCPSVRDLARHGGPGCASVDQKPPNVGHDDRRRSVAVGSAT